jgi:uncharacterized membrane protein YkoI
VIGKRLRQAAIATFVCGAIALGGVGEAPARPLVLLDFSFVRTPDIVAQRGPVSLQQAVAIARQRYRGRVVRAETISRNGRRVHEVRILDEEEGRVRTVQIDAESGQGE